MDREQIRGGKKRMDDVWRGGKKSWRTKDSSVVHCVCTCMT